VPLFSKLKLIEKERRNRKIPGKCHASVEEQRITEESVERQFKNKLALSQSANTQALQLLSRVGPILMQHQIIASRVNYDTAVLNMDLVAKNAEGLQTLVTQLNQQGFKAELGNVQTQGASVVGLVKIQ